jgi:acyl-CoA-dependent ceramide synthase
MLTLLKTSKVLNYIDSPLIIPYFGVFIFAWVYLRHYHNLRFLSSMLPLPWPLPPDTTLALQRALAPVTSLLAPLSPALLSLKRRLLSVPLPPALLARLPALPATAQFATVGPFTLDWAGQHYKFPLSQWITFGLLAALQAVNLFWLFLIARILWRMLLSFGDVVEDERSEYGSDDEEVDVGPAGDGVKGGSPEGNGAVGKSVGNGAVRAG